MPVINVVGTNSCATCKNTSILDFTQLLANIGPISIKGIFLPLNTPIVWKLSSLCCISLKFLPIPLPDMLVIELIAPVTPDIEFILSNICSILKSSSLVNVSSLRFFSNNVSFTATVLVPFNNLSLSFIRLLKLGSNLSVLFSACSNKSLTVLPFNNNTASVNGTPKATILVAIPTALGCMPNLAT